MLLDELFGCAGKNSIYSSKMAYTESDLHCLYIACVRVNSMYIDEMRYAVLYFLTILKIFFFL